jgi:hypothetical protein
LSNILSLYSKQQKTEAIYSSLYVWTCCCLLEGDHVEDPDVDGRILLKWIFEKWYGGTHTGSIWLMIGTDGWLLWMR